jgi:pyruvate kinase
LPMVAMSSKQSTLNLVALYKGVLSGHLPFDSERNSQLNEAVLSVQRMLGLQSGDYIAITYGDVVGVDGNTNTLKIIKVA